MTSSTAATPRPSAPPAAPPAPSARTRTGGAQGRDAVCVLLAGAALVAGGVAAFNPVLYRAELTLQVRAPADAEPAPTSLDAEAREAAVELGAAGLATRVRADLAHADPERSTPVGQFDDLVAGGASFAAPGALGVGVRLVPGAGRIHLSRLSFSAVRAPLVLNTLADEFVRLRAARVADQEQRLAAALAEVEDQLLANAAAADRLMTRGGVADHDLLAAAAPPAYSRLLAEQYVGGAPGTETASPPAAREAARDAWRERLDALRLRRAELAARYLPGAAPIRELDAVIQALEAAAPKDVPDGRPAPRAAPPRARAGVAALVRKWSAARSLTPRLDQLARQASGLRADADALSAGLARVRLRRLTGVSAGADVDVVDRARVPDAGTGLRFPLEILAIVLLGVCVALRRRTGRAIGGGLPSTDQGALS